MKILLLRKWKLVAAVLIGLGVGGCSIVPEPTADVTRYFILTTPQSQQGVDGFGSGPLRIGLNRIEVSTYLDKGSLVVRRGDNELIYNDYTRWAEPIGQGIARIVRTRLLDSPKVGRVFVGAFPFDQTRDYDISIYVTSCEGVVATGSSRFAAIVEITTIGDNSKVVSRREFVASLRTWDGRDYASLVESLSEDVGAMCDQIVATLPMK